MSPSSAAPAQTSPATTRKAAQTGAPARRSPGPRRISGPAHHAHRADPAHPADRADPARPAARPQRTARPAVRSAPSSAPFTQHVTRVFDHSLLDRLIRGRAWIGLIGFALIGIVAMQVTLLKLNAGIGRSVQRVTVLQRQSSALAAEVAGLSAAERVQSQATGLGMVYAPPNDVRYLHVSPGDAARAATAFVAPSASPPPSSTSASSSSTPAGSTSASGAPVSSASIGP
ncbi:MAG: hypothetical protein QOH12_942 [Solirubrobacteraceae bacterium]|nr:hypothetical protein [Solirubrobacteraceae bacterium]